MSDDPTMIDVPIFEVSSASSVPGAHEQFLALISRELELAILGPEHLSKPVATPPFAGAGTVPDASVDPPRHSRKMNLPLDLLRPLSQADVDALPNGTPISVSWLGLNEPRLRTDDRDATVVVDDHGERWAAIDGRENALVDAVGQAPLFVEVRHRSPKATP